MTTITKVGRSTFLPGDPGVPEIPGTPGVPARCVEVPDGWTASPPTGCKTWVYLGINEQNQQVWYCGAYY